MEVKAKHGKVLSELTPWCKCAVCGQRAYLTDWVPPNGLDQQIRQFMCGHDHTTYRHQELHP